MELEKAKKKLELMEYKYTLTNNDDKAIEVVLKELNKYEIETASKIANRVNEMSVQEMQEFLKPYTLYEKIIETQNKKIEELKRNSISKEKIKDIICYKKRKLQQIKYGEDSYRKNCLQIEIDILEQLLEEDK